MNRNERAEERQALASSIEGLAKAVSDAEARHAEAVDATRAASSEETARLNTLNEHQKRLDEAMQSLRNGSHRSTNWGSHNREWREVTE